MSSNKFTRSKTKPYSSPISKNLIEMKIWLKWTKSLSILKSLLKWFENSYLKFHKISSPNNKPHLFLSSFMPFSLWASSLAISGSTLFSSLHYKSLKLDKSWEFSLLILFWATLIWSLIWKERVKNDLLFIIYILFIFYENLILPRFFFGFFS